MYIWNVRALKRDLNAQPLSESQLFGYFLTVLMVETTLWQMLSLFPSDQESGLWEYLAAIGGLGLTLVGTLLVWRANGGTAGRNFLGRYFPLFWVLSVRFLVMATPLFALVVGAAFVSEGWLDGSEAEIGDGSTISMAVTIVTWTVTVLFYYRLMVHVRDVAKNA